MKRLTQVNNMAAEAPAVELPLQYLFILVKSVVWVPLTGRFSDLRHFRAHRAFMTHYTPRAPFEPPLNLFNSYAVANYYFS